MVKKSVQVGERLRGKKKMTMLAREEEKQHQRRLRGDLEERNRSKTAGGLYRVL